MSKNGNATFPQAANDFVKSNGVDASFRTVGPSLTRQEFVEECDINTLMSKYDKHAGTGPGMLSHQDPSMFYADFTQLPDSLLEYHNYMDRAHSSFMTLPAAVRREFENDATMFVEFASDPENLSQMRTWGLAPPEKVEAAPMKVEVVSPAAPPPGPPEKP